MFERLKRVYTITIRKMTSPDAYIQWAEEAERRHQAGKFGEIVRAVIWTDARGSDGQLLVAVDPDRLVTKITAIRSHFLRVTIPDGQRGNCWKVHHLKVLKVESLSPQYWAITQEGTF